MRQLELDKFLVLLICTMCVLFILALCYSFATSTFLRKEVLDACGGINGLRSLWQS